MTYAYYPGCTLKNKASALDRNARHAFQKLGVELVEIPHWECCGGAYPLSQDEIATRLAAVRALKWARAHGMPLLTLCAACHNVIKQVNRDMASNSYIAQRVNNYLNDGEYHGETKVVHYLELLRDEIGFEEVRRRTTAPLTGVRVGAYYGCLLLRPSRVLQMDDPENPQIIEGLLRAIGAEPVLWARRNECCGGYITLEDRRQAEKNAAALVSNAAAQGAQLLVTACPLCRYNLEQNTPGSDLPVVYFTQLLAQALGVKEAEQA
ncbi:MAG: CoB--CoM heterodisulfide reductase iron-sulfur subunit B family protein [Eubacteriales bacterium]|nr:CoB--CoM heterodisulfide reductase iron-sulfur subunit B family protein [Eubacteriales bacterium]